MVLTELRKVYRISMQTLGDEIGVSKQLIGMIEKSQREVTNEVLYKLVRYFNLDSQVTSDYKGFLTGKTMNKLEILEIKRAKIEKEIAEFKKLHNEMR